MKTFYTNVKQYGQKMLVRGIEDGRRIKRKIDYSPYMFVRSNESTEFTSIHGDFAERMDFENIREAREFCDKYNDVHGFEIYGMNEFTYPFINDEWAGRIEYDVDLVNVVSLDIETMSDDGFPNIELADKAITVITISNGKEFVVIGMGDFVPHMENVRYINCKTENDLLIHFLVELERMEADIYTGWNIEFFDIPYLYNRIERILGASYAKRLSPWGIARERIVKGSFGGDRQTYDLAGVAILDYLAVYKKFTYTTQESYKLDYIAEVELGQNKIDYSEYGSLDELYKQNYQLYVEYNILDTQLIDKLEEKLKLLELAIAIAYDAKINYEDALTSVKMWDVIIHNYLMDKKIVIPQKKMHPPRSIVGGFVKEPIPDQYNWVVSFDLNSLYPHLIMQYNISPEKFVTKFDPNEGFGVDAVLNGSLNDPELRSFMKERNVTFTPTGCAWSRDEEGFLPALMQKMYSDRKTFKKMMLAEEQKFIETENADHQKAAVRYDKIQMAKKIQLNSAYGALGNAYFRWFNPDHAESITMGGQLSIRWIEGRLNKYINSLMKTEGKDYVIAVDTDSVYLNLGDLVKKKFGENPDRKEVVDWLDNAGKKAFEPFIDKSYKELYEYTNAFQQKMEMSREAIAEKGIWTGKKRYILSVWNNEGVSYEKFKLKMMGIEAVRSSTPSVVRKAIKDALMIIMDGTEEQLIEYNDKFRREFKTLPFEAVSFPRGLNNLEKYKDPVSGWKKATPAQVRGAIVFNLLVKEKKLEKKVAYLRDGDKIKFCYLTMPNPARSNIITMPDGLPEGFDDLAGFVDYDTQFEKTYTAPMKKITDVIGWNQEHVSTLEGFFG